MSSFVLAAAAAKPAASWVSLQSTPRSGTDLPAASPLLHVVVARPSTNGVRFRLENTGNLHVKHRVPIAFASGNSSTETAEGEVDNRNSDVPDGPPLATILFGVLVFLLVSWLIGSLVMWIVGLVVNVLRS